MEVVVNAHNDDGRLAAAVDEEAFIVFDGSLHDLAELSAGREGGDFSGHVRFQLIN